MGVASAIAGATVALATLACMGFFSKGSQQAAAEESKTPAATSEEYKNLPNEVVAVIGDVGGTNVRLTLRKLCLKTRTSTEIKPL